MLKYYKILYDPKKSGSISLFKINEHKYSENIIFNQKKFIIIKCFDRIELVDIDDQYTFLLFISITYSD